MYSLFRSLARLMAFLGGAVLSLLIILTCLSIVGRALNGVLHGETAQAWFPGIADRMLGWGIGPINGDFELVEAGMAFVIFAFLPLCQITYSHAKVDLLTTRLPVRIDRWLRIATEVVFAAVLILIAVQLFGGMQSKLRSGQTTFQIEFPIWWAYALALTGAVCAALVATYLASLRVLEGLTGRTILPDDTGEPL